MIANIPPTIKVIMPINLNVQIKLQIKIINKNLNVIIYRNNQKFYILFIKLISLNLIKQIIFQKQFSVLNQNKYKQLMRDDQQSNQDKNFIQINYKPKNNQNQKIYCQDTYLFPVKLLNKIHLSGKKQFKILIQNQAEDTTFEKGWRIYKQKLINSNQFSIYIRCIYCSAMIHYHQNSDQSWTLLKYQNNHNHRNNNQYKHQVSLNVIKKNKNNFMSKKRRKYILQRKIEQSQNSFKLTIQLLTFLGYDFRYEYSKNDIDKQGFPQILVAVSVQNKINYRKYGDCIAYDINYDCIKQITYNNQKLSLAIFSGFDNNKRVVIFGFSIVNNFDTNKKIKNIFSWFFDLMKFCNTTTIITEEKQILIQGIQQLNFLQKYHFHHIYDFQHLIRQFLSQLKAKKVSIIDQIIAKLNKITNQSDKNIAELQLHSLKILMKNYNLNSEYEKLVSKIDHIFLWKMPKQYIGLSLSSHQITKDILRLKMQQKIGAYQLVERLDEISKQRYMKSEYYKTMEIYPFQIHFEDIYIKQIRQKLQKKAFASFISNYNRSQFYQFTHQLQGQQNQYQIYHVIYKFTYIISKFVCECGCQQKIGIPCDHLIFLKRNIFPEISYLNLIKQRWLISQQKSKEILTSKGNRKKPRKNQIL